MTRYIGLVVMAVLCTGCFLKKNAKYERAIEKASKPSDERVKSMTLVAPTGSPEHEVRPGVRIVIDGETISVDNTPYVREIWRGCLSTDRERRDAAPLEELLIEEPDLVTLDDGLVADSDLEDGTRISALEKVLRAQHGLQDSVNILCGLEDPEFLHVTVYMSPDVTYDVLQKVSATALESGYILADLVLSNGKVVRSPFDRFNAGGPLHDDPVETCVVPLVGIVDGGAMLDTEMGLRWTDEASEHQRQHVPNVHFVSTKSEKLVAKRGSIDVENLASWHGGLVLGPEKTCPSVGLEDGSLDVEALISLIGETEVIHPTCRKAYVGAQSRVTWSGIAPLLETLQQADFIKVLLAPALEDVDPDCSGGLRPAESIEEENLWSLWEKVYLFDVSITDLKVDGQLDETEVQQVLNEHQAEIEFAYRSGLDDDPGIEGDVTIEFVVSSTGAVADSKVVTSDLGSPETESMISKLSKRWVFPEPHDGAEVTVSLTHHFDREVVDVKDGS